MVALHTNDAFNVLAPHICTVRQCCIRAFVLFVLYGTHISKAIPLNEGMPAATKQQVPPGSSVQTRPCYVMESLPKMQTHPCYNAKTADTPLA